MFNSLEVGWIRYIGVAVKAASYLISALQARNYIANGALAYLALIVEDSSSDKKI